MRTENRHFYYEKEKGNRKRFPFLLLQIMLFKLAGRAALVFLENAVKGRDALETGFHGDGGDGGIGISQKILCPFQSLLRKVLNEIALNGLLEHSRKIT